MEEKEYLRVDNLLVTSTRIELDGQTFAVRNVGSVKVVKSPAPWLKLLFALVFGFSGVAGMAGGAGLVGLAMLALAAALGFYAWRQMAMQRLVLLSGGGEVVGFASRNGAAVERVRAAIAQAIAAR